MKMSYRTYLYCYTVLLHFYTCVSVTMLFFSHQSDHAAVLQAYEHDLKMRESRLQKVEHRLRNWAAELEEADYRTKENHLRAKEAMKEPCKMKRESLDLAVAIGVELDQKNDTLNSCSPPANTQLATGSGATNPQTFGRESGATPQQWPGGPPPASGYHHDASTGYQQLSERPTGYQVHTGEYQMVALSTCSPQLRRPKNSMYQSIQVIPFSLSF